MLITFKTLILEIISAHFYVLQLNRFISVKFLQAMKNSMFKAKMITKTPILMLIKNEMPAMTLSSIMTHVQLFSNDHTQDSSTPKYQLQTASKNHLMMILKVKFE